MTKLLALGALLACFVAAPASAIGLFSHDFNRASSDRLDHDWPKTKDASESSDGHPLPFMLDHGSPWPSLTEREVGDNHFLRELIGLGERAADARIRLLSHTNVGSSTESARLRRFILGGHSVADHVERGDRAHMPEPTGAALFGIGLFAIARTLRRR